MSRFPRLLILSALVVGAALAGCRRDDSLYRPVDDSGASRLSERRLSGFVTHVCHIIVLAPTVIAV